MKSSRSNSFLSAENKSGLRKVLFVIDMINDFIHPDGALYCGDTARNIVPYIAEKIKQYDENNWPIIFICDAHDENDKEFERFPKHAVKDTWGADIFPPIQNVFNVSESPNFYFIEKKRYSGFYNTELDEIINLIKNCHAPELLIFEVVGVCTSICIQDTVGDLANRDLEVWIPIKGVADFDPEAHQCALNRMNKIYGAKITEK